MGLASYGKPNIDVSWLLREADDEHGFFLDTTYLHNTVLAQYPAMHGLQQPSFSKALIRKLGPARIPGTEITPRHKDIAASVQRRLEEVVIHLVKRLHAGTGFRNLCVAGGVGLNCSMNGALLAMDCVDALFVPPWRAMRALHWARRWRLRRGKAFLFWQLEHASYGPEYSTEQIRSILERSKLRYQEHADVVGFVAEALAGNKIVGWFQGAMEFGPRALGNRSILADAV